MTEKVKWVSMKHKQSGKDIHGVHPDAVPAHEAIGYEVFIPEKPEKEEVCRAENAGRGRVGSTRNGPAGRER